MPRTHVRSSLRLAALAALMAGAAAPALAQQAQTGTSDPAQAPAAQAPAPAAPAAEAPAAQAPALAPAAPAQQAPAQAQQAPAQQAPAQQAPQQPAGPQPQVVATHGDWTILCLDGKPPCIMRQLGYNADGREVMELSIRRIPPQQTQQGTVEAVMDVRVPLGVFLREGLSLQIDSAESQRAQFSICLSEGCLMRQPIPNAMVSAMKKGAVAKFGFVVPQGGQGGTEFNIDISLSGFTAAYNALAE
ncbi:invasion associated locus B family protein [Albimonas sp. CAU 1670]|uniref:invasion associated locus B family protein n=1 Tax=Albimonas sp. CAU 1670 TaxID=3032599 RepID=UPI0023D9F595|nr:invasion associated locus B family protein [Albimonas sp. CAU 1670]MDF2233069.1 invasion associated locus B family protein [Albimonas sp. CAU 1670]